MTFRIVIEHERKKLRLTVTRLTATDSRERWEVKARNTTFTLDTNRPLLRNKGLKHKRAIWEVKDGKAPTKYILDKITAAIENEVNKNPVE
jgi:hypothetical protein